jgi:hypothetical protein
VSRGRVGARGGGGDTTDGVGEDNCAGTRRRCSRRRGGEGRRGGGRAPEAGEDGATAAEPRRLGQVGEKATHVPGADGGRPVAWRRARASAEFGRPAAAENPVGQRTGGAAEGGGRGG